MQLYLTMAGPQPHGQTGYRTPSYLLPWADGTVLSKILDGLLQRPAISAIYLVAAQRDEVFAPHVRAIMAARQIPKENLLLVGETRGQAATADLAMRMVEERDGAQPGPVLIHNVDTILTARDLATVAVALTEADGYVDVFRAHHHKYSYVLIEEPGREVVEIAEKIMISDSATSGLYGFRDVATFRAHFDAATDRPISAVYRRMMDRDQKIVAGQAYSEADTVVISTPDEYWNASVLLG